MYAFEFVRPATVEEAVAALAAEEAQAIAGGQTLIPTLKQRLAKLSDVVDLNGIKELAGRATKTDSAKLTSPVGDFYMTNPIARSSAIMAECSQMQAGLKQAAE